MGQYKVPQNVESDDKIIGPFTLKQFIYITIGIVYGLLSFTLLKSVIFIWLVVGVPPMAIMVLLGAYHRSDQPFETYLVNIVGFFVKPRKRVWHKDPIVDTFHISQPKITAEQARRDPRDVLGELEKLAHVVDTRGWSTKSPEIQEPTPVAALSVKDNDRIVAPDVPQVTEGDISSDLALSDDILDFRNNPSAQNLNKLLTDTVGQHHQQAINNMKQPLAAPKAESKPTDSQPNPSTQSTSEMTDNPLAGILKIAMDNEDLTISQLSNHVQKQQTVIPEGQSVELR